MSHTQNAGVLSFTKSDHCAILRSISWSLRPVTLNHVSKLLLPAKVIPPIVKHTTTCLKGGAVYITLKLCGLTKSDIRLRWGVSTSGFYNSFKSYRILL